MVTYIYILSHPLTGEIKYVGKTVNPKQRKHNHSNVARDKGTYKRNWINSLKVQGLRPKFEIIDQVSSDWKFWERYWISQFKAWGFELCNYCQGGEGLETSNQTSFRKGQTPWNKGTAQIKVLKGTAGKELNSVKNQFKKGFKPWNKDVKGIKLKPDKKVHQYNPFTGYYINTFKTAKEAGNTLIINIEGIGQVCRGKAKSAGGFIWSYEFKEQIKIMNNIKLKIKTQ